ncbi:MAG: DUF4340 domain-containing protein [Dehalococcoidia bacterium]|nr:DUF4340 domain-containing protein [Dehalococcoidia bacterium]
MNIRTTFVLVMFLSVVAGYFLLADFRSRAVVEPASPWFYTANMDDITRMSFSAGETTYAFYRDRTNPKESVWRFDDEFSMPVDTIRWGGISLLLSGPQARRALFRDLKEPEKFGLIQPSLSVDVLLTGDRLITIHLGDKTPDNASYYVSQEGNPGLYLVDSTWGDVLARLVTAPPYPYWYYKIDPSKPFFMRVTQGGQEYTYFRERIVGKPDAWRLSGRNGDPVDVAWWDEQVKPLLGGPSGLRVLQRGIDDLAKYGLDNPAVTVFLETDPLFPPRQNDESPELRREIFVYIGKPLEDGSGYYAQAAAPPGPIFPSTLKDLEGKYDKQDFLLVVDNAWRDLMVQLATAPKLAPKPPPEEQPAAEPTGGPSPAPAPEPAPSTP